MYTCLSLNNVTPTHYILLLSLSLLAHLGQLELGESLQGLCGAVGHALALGHGHHGGLHVLEAVLNAASSTLHGVVRELVLQEEALLLVGCDVLVARRHELVVVGVLARKELADGGVATLLLRSH